MKNKNSMYMIIGISAGIIWAIVNRNISYIGIGAVAGLILQTVFGLFKNKNRKRS